MKSKATKTATFGLRLLLTLLLSISTPSHSQQLQATLDTSAYATLLTCGPGEEYFTSFGHTAIRITDTTIPLDIVYNYGTFDFDTPHFYLRFAYGNLNYALTRTSYNNFLYEYATDGRAVYQQQLNLSNQELNNLFTLLENNYLPQYRYYRYDFLNDNCATRVRDIIAASLNHRTLLTPQPTIQRKTYRQLIHEQTPNSPWWNFGIDLLTGAKIDRTLNSLQYTFLPSHLAIQIDTTITTSQQHIAQPIQQLLPDNQPSPTPTPFYLHPLFYALILLLLTTTLTILQPKRHLNLLPFDIILFSLAGLASLIIIFTTLISLHTIAHLNFNLLWASPLFILLAIRPNRASRPIYIIQLALLILAIVISIIQYPQAIPLPAALIAASLTIRLLPKIIKPHNTTNQKNTTKSNISQKKH